jgi:hypothetical protein
MRTRTHKTDALGVYLCCCAVSANVDAVQLVHGRFKVRVGVDTQAERWCGAPSHRVLDGTVRACIGIISYVHGGGQLHGHNILLPRKMFYQRHQCRTVLIEQGAVELVAPIGKRGLQMQYVA